MVQMKKAKNLGALWVALFVTGICAVIIVPYLETGTAFILGWDMRTIYSSNFENLRTMLTAWKENGTMPFWSWVSFLGNDFYSSKLFYFNDFWEYIFAFTDLPYTDAIIWMTYFRFLVTGLSFYAYARYNRCSERTSILSSLLWTFSAYLLQIMRDPFFASFISFLPLYFLSVDRYIEEGKHGFFIFMVFFMYFNSYYLFYMTSLFTILYFLWRYDRRNGTLKGSIPSALKLIGYYIVGFMISGIIVVPEVLNILNNSRVGERSMVWLYTSIVPYLEYLSGIFTPVSMLAYRGTEISNLYLWNTPNHQIMANYVWAGSVTALLLPQCFTRKNYRKMNGVIVISSALISLIPIFSSVMHGFSEPSFRWTANLTFLLVAMILPLLEDKEKISKQLLKITTGAVPALLLITPLLFAKILNVSFTDIQSDYRLVVIEAILMLVIGIFLINAKKAMVFTVSAAELCFVSYYTYFGNPTQSAMKKTDADRMTNVLGTKDEFNNWILTLDGKNYSSFYRIYVNPQDVYWGLGTNYNMDENIRGLMIYDSTYLASMNDLITLDPDHVIDYLPWTFDIENPDIMTLVSTKYAVTGPDTPCPFRNGILRATYAASWNIYENLDYINLGKTYTGIMTYNDYSSDDSSVVTQKVICHAEDEEEIRALLGSEEVQFTDASAEGNDVYASITTSEAGFAVLSVPYDQGWRVYVNGAEVKTYKVNGGMTGIAVQAGENDVHMEFVPRGLKQGKYVSMAGLAALLLVIIVDLRRNRMQKNRND